MAGPTGSQRERARERDGDDGCAQANAVELHGFGVFAPHEQLLAACSGRLGGVSAAPYDTLNLGLHVGDEPAAVVENRRRLAAAVGVAADALVFAQQVHGARVAVVGAQREGGAASRPQSRGGADELGAGGLDPLDGVDALVTRERGLALTVLVADCVPVLLYDPRTPAVGVAHAGWRGTVAHVARRTVETMTSAFGTDPRDVLAGIGPSIGPASYEVGADVAARAVAEFPGERVVARRDGATLLDLWAANVADLVAAGVPRAGVEVMGVDTYARTQDFFSHRRGHPTGRFAAIALLRAAPWRPREGAGG